MKWIPNVYDNTVLAPAHQPVVTSGCFRWFNGVKRTGVFSPLALSLSLSFILAPFHLLCLFCCLFPSLSWGRFPVNITFIFMWKAQIPLWVVCSQSAVLLLSFKGDSSDVLAPLTPRTPRFGSTQGDLWAIIKGMADSAVTVGCWQQLA